ncbi:hypothetical protein M8J77_014990 [Diaphorina citri]|nr:hypothetical protein M8J77_014990 [Diaphorina citri]
MGKYSMCNIVRTWKKKERKINFKRYEMTGGGGAARHRAMQAVDYYNSNVLKARIHAGLTSERHGPPHHGHYHPGRHTLTQEQMYRSNSSLELMHAESGDSLPHGVSNPTLRREYGSHGSIDVISNNGGPVSESFFAMLQDYRPTVLGMMVTDQRSPGPAEYLRPRGETVPSNSDVQSSLSSSLVDETDGRPSGGSPNLKLKFQRLFGGQSGGAGGKPLRAPSSLDDSSLSLSPQSNGIPSSLHNGSPLDPASDQVSGRRRVFAHYDVPSVSANLGYAARVRSMLLARRRNTSTGASAASSTTRASTPDSDEDGGDGRCNHLIESCPFFRNEIGGEGVREVSLSRLSSPPSPCPGPLHRPPLAYGVAILEYPEGETHWKHGTCPYQNIRHIESVDAGALYYRKYFYGQEHQNWLGMDDNLGPVAISLKREKVEYTQESQQMYRYRLLIRTSELQTLRGSVLEDNIPNLKPSSSSNSKSLNAKEVLEYVAPEVQLSCLRLGVSSQAVEDQLLKLDEQALTSHYKVGVMYCRAGQSTEEDMYNNEEAGPALNEFLDTIGHRVRLKGFEKYRAGLDNKTDSTGLYSVYSEHQGCQVMFHVSPLLPFTPHNRQQLLRKRHIGNDIVTIVFQEPGSLPFTPKTIRSQFQHVFIVVRALNPNSDHTQYSVAVSRSKEVPLFGPPIPENATFNKSKEFRDFLLSKIINGENAAHRSEKFATMATRTRQEYLKDLTQNYATSTLIEPSQKFSMPLFSSKKKERWRPRIIPDTLQKGAICWQVSLEDSKTGSLMHCVLAISTDSVVLVEEQSRDLVFVAPAKSVLGWATSSNSLRLYHHQGEVTRIHMREGGGGDRDELMEVVVRLRAATPGSPAQELTLKRNGLGQLGFHVQPDGLVTEVEHMGLAYQEGLKQGCRLVEICKVAVSTLSHDQMVDLLKTSSLVTVTVIPALSDGTPRSGCTLINCPYNSMSFESEYENVTGVGDADLGVGKLTITPSKSAALQQAPVSNAQRKSQQQAPVSNAQRKRYERSFSPPRSSNSSGYGTGSSSRSFMGVDNRFPVSLENPSSTHPSSGSPSVSTNPPEERWYDTFDPSLPSTDSPPPPLPARILSHPKVSSSSSLPLSNSTLSLSHEEGGAPHEFKVGEKVTNCLIKASERSHELRRHADSNPHLDYHHLTLTRTGSKMNDYMGGSQSSNVGGDKTFSLPNDAGSPCTDRFYSVQSEDELSTGSSPRLRHCPRGSSGGSGAGSPRPRDTGEARLRPGVTCRASGNNRHSASLSSTLQQDLIRLISPDYSSENETNNSTSSAVNPALGKGDSSTSSNGNTDERGDGEVTATARPIATATPPADNKKLSKEERLSPRVTGGSTGTPGVHPTSKSPSSALSGGGKPEPPTSALPLPDTQEMDWPSLVDTATRAMSQVNGGPGSNLGQWAEDFAGRLGLDSNDSQVSSRRLANLQKYLSQLESRLSREMRRRHTLEEELKDLREENKKLKEESQNALQQLRRFTEWFFQTIDKQ